MSAIDEILEKTKERVDQIDPASFPKRNEKIRNFKESVRKGFVIAELKPASPSKGELREFDPKIAEKYEKGGACALSVLTEPYFFKGNLHNIEKVKSVSSLPVLRKDFIIDPIQIEESYSYGADAVLLLTEFLPNLKEMLDQVNENGLDALVEVETEDGVRQAIEAGAEIIGINNRNLQTLEIDLERTERLIKEIPKGILTVSESGIETSEQAKKMKELGVTAILVGTSLMLAEDIEQKVKEFSGA
jgi:indole-3-glycerol phosphate synthase